MINANQAKNNANYYHSEKRKLDVRREIINMFIDYLSKEIDEGSSRGIYSITEKLKGNPRIWSAWIEDKEEVDYVKQCFEEKGFTVSIEYHKDGIEIFNMPCETEETPVITISWDN